jgi:hypothetical protein
LDREEHPPLRLSEGEKRTRALQGHLEESTLKDRKEVLSDKSTHALRLHVVALVRAGISVVKKKRRELGSAEVQEMERTF